MGVTGNNNTLFIFCNSFIIMQAMAALGQGKDVTPMLFLAVKGGVGRTSSVGMVGMVTNARKCNPKVILPISAQLG